MLSGRAWIKIYCDKWLRGNIRQERPEFRSVLIDLLSLAAERILSCDGFAIFSDDEIQSVLKLDTLKWKCMKKKLINLGYCYAIGSFSVEIDPSDLVSFHAYFTSKTHRLIYEIDNFECVYCGSKSDLSIDHIIPTSKGGDATKNNLVTACMSCNCKKHARTPSEAKMKFKYGRYNK